MKIKSFKIKDFQNTETESVIDVPTGSIYRDMKLFHDGIYAFFEVPEMLMNSTERHKYKLVTGNSSIPSDSIFIALLDVIVEVPPEKEGEQPKQGIQIIPIYEIK